MHLTGDLAHNLGMCPHWESNPQLFTSQVDTQPTEPPQSGFKLEFLVCFPVTPYNVALDLRVFSKSELSFLTNSINEFEAPLSRGTFSFSNFPRP